MRSAQTGRGSKSWHQHGHLGKWKSKACVTALELGATPKHQCFMSKSKEWHPSCNWVDSAFVVQLSFGKGSDSFKVDQPTQDADLEIHWAFEACVARFCSLEGAKLVQSLPQLCLK